MKKLFVLCIVVLPLCISLSSCYAFLHANELVYQGTIGKKIPPVEVREDSLTVKAHMDAAY